MTADLNELIEDVFDPQLRQIIAQFQERPMSLADVIQTEVTDTAAVQQAQGVIDGDTAAIQQAQAKLATDQPALDAAKATAASDSQAVLKGLQDAGVKSVANLTLNPDGSVASITVFYIQQDGTLGVLTPPLASSVPVSDAAKALRKPH